MLNCYSTFTFVLFSPLPIADAVIEPSWADRVKGRPIQPVPANKSGASPTVTPVAAEDDVLSQTPAVTETKQGATTKEEGHEGKR